MKENAVYKICLDILAHLKNRGRTLFKNLSKSLHRTGHLVHPQYPGTRMRCTVQTAAGTLFSSLAKVLLCVVSSSLAYVLLCVGSNEIHSETHCYRKQNSFPV
jgi:hypothetical protein